MKTPNLIMLSKSQRTLAACMLNEAGRSSDLHNKLLDLQSQMDAITDNAEQAGRDLTYAEVVQHEDLVNRYQDTKAKINRMEKLQDNPNRPEPNMPGGGVINRGGGNGSRFVNAATGDIISAYRHGENLGSLSNSDGPVIGEMLRAMALGDVSMLPSNLRNAISTGSDTDGGYLTNPSISTRFIDLARSASIVTRAGAESIQVPGDVIIGKITSDPTVNWRGETSAITASKPVFGSINIKPKVAAVLIPVSMEFAEDAANGPQLIEQVAQAALASAIDKAALVGSGSGAEPLGVVNDPDVNSQTAIGTPTTYGQITMGIQDILTANYDGPIEDLSWIMNPVIGGTYDGLVTGISGDNSPLMPTPWASQLQRFHTTSLEANGSSEYDMVVGQFGEMLLAFRAGGIRLQVLQEGSASDGSKTWNATSQMLVWIRAHVQVDVAILRPSHFSVLSGVTA